MTSEPDARVLVAGDVPSRLLAAAVDLVVVSALVFVLAIPIGVVLGPVVRIDPTADRAADLLDIDRSIAAVHAAAALLVSGCYFVALWSRSGRTLGSRWFGLRVRHLGGGALGAGRAATRWLVTWAPLSLLGLGNAVAAPAGLQAGLAALVAGWYGVQLVTTSRSWCRRGLHDRLAGSTVTKRAVALSWPPDVDRTPDVG